MAPKKKAVSKKVMPKIIEDMSNVTVRRPIVNSKNNDVNDVIDDEIKNEENSSTMNVTVVLEKKPDFFVKKTESSELKQIIDEEELGGKKVIPKKVAKTKPKTKKPTLDEDSNGKKNINEDCQTIKVKEKVVGRSRKRPVDKDESKLSKSVSPINEPMKRNRRAASVDILSCGDTKRNLKAVVTQEEIPKKNRKGVKKEQIDVEKNIKTKKITKKMTVGEKGNLITPEKDDTESNDILHGKPKPKKGFKKEQIDEHIEDVVDEIEKVLPKQTSKDQGTLKVKEIDDEKNKPKLVTKSIHKNTNKSPQNSEESSGKNESEDSDIIAKTPEPKIKRVRKGKVNKSPEESSEKNTDDDSDIVAKMASIKSKRICKGRQVVEENSIEEKNLKLKKRVGRKVKDKDFEEDLMQKSLPVCGIEEQNMKTGDLPDGLPDNPESGKNDIKPVAAKRKTKTRK